MRVLDCDCGTTLQAANDEELVEQVKQHIEQEHPDMDASDDDVRARVSEQAYDATDS
jgi:predicted small metal-binding protein